MALYSCQDNLEDTIESSELTKEQVDKNIRNLSEVVAKAASTNQELVNEIAKEISYRFDYDNDALLKVFLGRKINGEKFEDILSEASKGTYSSKDIEKMIVESGYLQFTFPQNYQDLDYKNVTPLAVPVYSFISEEDTEYLESFDKNGNIVNLSAKEMPNVPVIVIGRSERVDEDGNMSVTERSVVLPKEMRSLHYTEAIENARLSLKSAKMDNHIVTVLTDDEFSKLKGLERSQLKVVPGDNLKSATFSDMNLTGFTVKAREMQLRWDPHTTGTYSSNRYKLYRDGDILISDQSGLKFTEDAPEANMVYTYIVEYYYNDILLGQSNDLELHSSHRTSGGTEYIDRLYASHAMVVAVEGWWVSE